MFPASAKQSEGKQTRESPVACPALILAAWSGSLAHLGRARFVAQADEDGCLLSICPAHWNSRTRRQGGAGVWSINVMLASRCSGAPKCSDWDTPGGPTDSREKDKWTTRSENDSTVRGREDPLIRRREAIKTGDTVQYRDALVLLDRVLFLTFGGWLAVHGHHHGSWFHTLDISNCGGKMAQERAPLMRL